MLGRFTGWGGHPSLTQNQQFEQFLDIFSNMLNEFESTNRNVYLFGDFNLDVLRYNICSKSTAYIELLIAHGFIQTITKPTRCTSHSATLLDHCVTNSSLNNHTSFIITTKISDHFPILYTLNKNRAQSTHKTFVHRNFSINNIENLKNVK